LWKRTTAGAAYINARTPEVVIGRSTTQLFRNLSVALKFQPGDELILSKFGHEANIAPWVSIAARSNLTIKWWTGDVDRTTSNPKLTLASLKPLLSDRTRLVTCTHASNVLGTIHDIKALAETVHTIPSAMLCVDAVAYAPHRRLDVKALDVYFYCFSWYKVYGPHIAMLYAREEVQDQLESLGHFLHPDDLEHKLGLAAANYETVQAIPEIVRYLGGEKSGGSFEQIAAHEEGLAEVLLGYLRGRGDVVILGGEGE